MNNIVIEHIWTFCIMSIKIYDYIHTNQQWANPLNLRPTSELFQVSRNQLARPEPLFSDKIYMFQYHLFEWNLLEFKVFKNFYVRN